MIVNAGPRIVRDVFINLEVRGPGSPSQIDLIPVHDEQWLAAQAFGRVLSMMMVDGSRLPPEAPKQPITVSLRLAPPFDDDLAIRGMLGSANSEPHRFELIATRARLQALHDEASSLDVVRRESSEASRFMNKLFDLGQGNASA